MPTDPQGFDDLVRVMLGEAADQGDVGLAAVAHVVRNRVNSGRFGNNVSSVVRARNQFEGFMPGQKYSSSDPAYRRAAAIAQGVLSDKIPDPTSGATHFLAPRAQLALGRRIPSWAKTLPQTTSIGDHVFFKEDGNMANGSPSLGNFVLPSFTPNSNATPADRARYVEGWKQLLRDPAYQQLFAQSSRGFAPSSSGSNDPRAKLKYNLGVANEIQRMQKESRTTKERTDTRESVARQRRLQRFDTIRAQVAKDIPADPTKFGQEPDQAEITKRAIQIYNEGAKTIGEPLLGEQTQQSAAPFPFPEEPGIDPTDPNVGRQLFAQAGGEVGAPGDASQTPNVRSVKTQDIKRPSFEQLQRLRPDMVENLTPQQLRAIVSDPENISAPEEPSTSPAGPLY